MDNILDELYFGNLDLNTQSFETGSSANKAAQKLADTEDKLLLLLDGKENSLFREYISAWSEVNAETAVRRFLFGFKVGARITTEALYGDL